jgi:hypothetical protein
MPVETLLRSEDCNCFAVRSAARHIRQLYDQFLAPIGLRTTQFSIGEARKTGTVDHPRTCKGHEDPTDRIRPSGQGAAPDQGGGEASGGGAQGLGRGAGTIRRRVRDQARGGPARLVAGGRGKRIRAMTAKAPIVAG